MYIQHLGSICSNGIAILLSIPIRLKSARNSCVETPNFGSAGMALGMVTQLPEEADEHSVTMRQLLAKLDVAMGGRVAEELIFGASDVTTGASSDLEQV